MKVKELISKLAETHLNAEVHIISQIHGESTPHLYLSFDDVGDVTIYEIDPEDEQDEWKRVIKWHKKEGHNIGCACLECMTITYQPIKKR